jgi:hypothetical protein
LASKDYKISHFTLKLSLHYLVKCKKVDFNNIYAWEYVTVYAFTENASKMGKYIRYQNHLLNFNVN